MMYNLEHMLQEKLGANQCVDSSLDYKLTYEDLKAQLIKEHQAS